MASLETRIKQWAHELGFELAGIAAATPADSFDRLRDWLEQGFAGEMTYMERHAEARRHPASIMPAVRSVVMVGMSYKPENTEGSTQCADGRSTQYTVASTQHPTSGQHSGTGEVNTQCPAPEKLSTGYRVLGTVYSSPAKVARYAVGADYHDVLRQRLKQLLARIHSEVPACRGRAVVDTAPLLERDFARRAGLGWFGKNTMLLNKRLGSYLFLGALLLDLELQPDPAHDTSHCGSCTACLDACPTQAFPAPGQLDARRCISYLTIELRGPVPSELRPGLGDWLFGCDVCQEVCPWNRKAPPGSEPAFAPRPELVALDPAELLSLSEEEFRHRFRTTALTRPRRRGLLRNAALVLGNRGDPAALPALRRALRDAEPLIREAAQWAIEQIMKKRTTTDHTDGTDKTGYEE